MNFRNLFIMFVMFVGAAIGSAVMALLTQDYISLGIAGVMGLLAIASAISANITKK